MGTSAIPVPGQYQDQGARKRLVAVIVDAVGLFVLGCAIASLIGWALSS